MSFSLRHDLSGPLYQQVFETIRLAIIDGRLGGGKRLPATRALSEQMGVSRNTVTTAYELLQAEGYIAAKQGSGYFVREDFPVAVADRPTKELPVKPDSNQQQLLSVRGQAMAYMPPKLFSRGDKPIFAPGVPDASHFPRQQWQRCVQRSARAADYLSAQYADPAGYWPLRQALCDYLKNYRGVDAVPEQILVLSGSQASLDICARMLLDPGDAVALENPGYFGAKDAFAAAAAEIAPIAVDGDGLSVEDLLQQFAKRPFKLVYTTPSCQFPSGVTLSLARRLALLDWAEKNNGYVIEDDYDSEYRYQGRPLSSMRGLAPGRVLYLGTFSKVMMPSIRLGYLVLPKGMAEPFSLALLRSGQQASLLAQAAMTLFINEGYFVSHLRRMRRCYAEKQQAFVKLAHRHLSRWLRVEPQPSGMQLACYYRQAVDEAALFAEAEKVGLSLTSLSLFDLASDGRKGLFIGFTAVPLAEMEHYVLQLQKLLFSISRQSPKATA